MTVPIPIRYFLVLQDSVVFIVPAELLTLIGNSRIFSFGIGADASAKLMTGLAKIGRGKVNSWYSLF